MDPGQAVLTSAARVTRHLRRWLETFVSQRGAACAATLRLTHFEARFLEEGGVPI